MRRIENSFEEGISLILSANEIHWEHAVCFSFTSIVLLVRGRAGFTIRLVISVKLWR
jgi:hypothetical protein